tara:strand:- start:178 stop:378 length:201 start_codon:yes stop_codon:yes gene_type:complete
MEEDIISKNNFWIRQIAKEKKQMQLVTKMAIQLYADFTAILDKEMNVPKILSLDYLDEKKMDLLPN